MALAQITESSMGHWERTLVARGGSSVMMRVAIWWVVSPSNGRRRVSSSYSMTPRLNTSVRWSRPMRLAVTCSGLM